MQKHEGYYLYNFPEVGDLLPDDPSLSNPLRLTPARWRVTLIENLTLDPYGTLDREIEGYLGDPTAYSPEAWDKKIVELRSDLRNLVYNIIMSQSYGLLKILINWTAKDGSPYYYSNALHFLKEDMLYTISYGFIGLHCEEGQPYQRIPKSALVEINNILPVLQARKRSLNQDFPSVVAAKWLLACHPETPQEVLATFAPEDPQWYTVLTHPNFSPSVLYDLMSVLLGNWDMVDGNSGTLDAILKNPWWDTSKINALYLETSRAGQEILIPYLVENEHCPPALLENFEQELSVTARARLASVTSDQIKLERLAYDKSAIVRKAVIDNPYASEEIKITAALLNG